MKQNLFKFVADETAIESIANGNVKFTRMSELNDPLELFGKTDTKLMMESLEHYRKVGCNDEDLKNLTAQVYLLQKLTKNHKYRLSIVPKTPEEMNKILKMQFLHNEQNIIELGKQYLAEIRAEMLKNTGVFCLSEKYNSLPMWAHYANNAKGFVVEFQDLESCFEPDETDVLNRLLKVNYDYVPSVTFAPDSYKNTFFFKYKDWRYEKEFRVLKALNDCNKTEPNLFLSQIPKEKIKRIIIGWNFEGDIQTLTNKIKAINPAIVISQAEISYQHFEISVRDIH